ncbi:MAG TPA: hypothetical protein VFG30_33645 [Polyangiales bacterium]|jgi:hypothetical protein|nr:hypothetical protein [Polyangiales bacterium]
MRTVIGEYESLAAAQQAVRALEVQTSTQYIVISDQTNSWWQKRDVRRDRSRDHAHSANFVVSMTGTADSIEQVRLLLHPPTTR